MTENADRHRPLQEHELLIVDGACGTNIQRMGLPPSAWGAHEGCNEFLNLSAPEAIESLHASFLEAGANVLETNTFGANAIVVYVASILFKIHVL